MQIIMECTLQLMAINGIDVNSLVQQATIKQTKKLQTKYIVIDDTINTNS